jgi:hypothetical protein
MVHAVIDFTVSLASDKTSVYLQVGPKSYNLSVSKAFSTAHEFFCRKKYGPASQICEALVQSESLGPQAAILLACCKVRLKDYSSCSEVLRTIFGANDTAVAEGLHTAFVYGALGMRSDAIRELAKIADDRPDLPTLYLLLGDLLIAAGQKDKAARCWQLAVQRDPRGGPIAREAQRGLSILLKQARPKQPERPRNLQSQTGDRGNSTLQEPSNQGAHG